MTWLRSIKELFFKLSRSKGTRNQFFSVAENSASRSCARYKTSILGSASRKAAACSIQRGHIRLSSSKKAINAVSSASSARFRATEEPLYGLLVFSDEIVKLLVNSSRIS